MRSTLRIGTRGSPLALAQAKQIAASLESKNKKLKTKLVIIKTTGDKILTKKIQFIGSKGVFVKELDDALLSGKIDLAVHSLKDLPSELTKGIFLAAITTCEDPRDAWVSNRSFSETSSGAKIGTASLRRAALLLRKRPDLKIEMLRGNVDTRLKKLDAGDYDAIVVAHAGLKRLGFAAKVKELFPPFEFIPAIGQGKLAITTRKDDRTARKVSQSIDDPEAHLLGVAERKFMELLQGGCQVPMGCYGEIQNRRAKIVGFISTPDGKTFVEGSVEGLAKQSVHLAEKLARNVLSKGGYEVLKQLRTGLEGKRVVVTRVGEQAEGLIDLLEQEKAIPIHLPTVKYLPPSSWSSVDGAVDRLDQYDLLIFTSANAVDFFFERLKTRKRRWNVQGKIAAIGVKTDQALQTQGIQADIVPTESNDALHLFGVILNDMALKSRNVLFVRATEGKETLIDRLKKAGANIETVFAYRTLPDPSTRKAIVRAMRQGEVDWITFASGSQVDAFFYLGNEVSVRKWIKKQTIYIAALGKTAAEALRKHGAPASVVADLPSMEALVRAMKEYSSDIQR